MKWNHRIRLEVSLRKTGWTHVEFIVKKPIHASGVEVMAKKPKVTYTLILAGANIRFDDVQVKLIDEKPGAERKFWLEPVGDKWRLLISKDFIFTDEHDDVMTFNRDADQCVAISRFGGYQIDLYNVIKVGDLNKRFYYLDEYQLGKLRLTHTDNMFPPDFDHNSIQYIELIKVTQ